VCLWFSSEFVSAVIFKLAWRYHPVDIPEPFLVYIPAFFSAMLVAFLLGKCLDLQPSLLPPPTPRPPPPPVPAPIPVPAAAGIFKFPCPHCGQRISTTPDQVGTDANCPTCEGPFVVPAGGA
jgi:hypothetical protein